MKFRKKPVDVEAVQWTGDNTFEVVSFMEGAPPDLSSLMAKDAWIDYCDGAKRGGLRVFTLEDGPTGEAKHIASVGDWIIRGVKGELYPCKPDIFEMTYEAAE